MIQLKEALINKNNAKNARQHYPEKYLFCPNSYLYYTVIRDKEMEEKRAPAYKCAYAWYLTDKDLVKHEDWIERGDEYSLWELPTRYIGEIKLLENVLENIKYASQLIKYGFKKLNSVQLRSRIKILKNKYDNLDEALIGRHNEKSFFGTVVYCMAVARNDIKDAILDDRGSEYYTWDKWGVLFIANDRIQYWINYCKKEIPRLGWWAGKIHTDSRQKAKKMLLRCQELEDVIEKIDGPSAI